MTNDEQRERAEPTEQTPEDRTSAPEVGEDPQRGDPGVGATAMERSTEALQDDSTEFDAGHIDRDELPGAHTTGAGADGSNDDN